MTNERSGVPLRAALCALAMLFLLAVPALASSDGVTNYRALLIGNSNYAERTGYASIDLPSCAYDLTAMKAALASGSVSFKKVSVKSNLSASGIASAVKEVRSWGMDDDDVTVFYYTGHGASSGLVGTGLNSSGTSYDVYSFSLLQSALGQGNVPGKVIVLLDSCESGGLIAKGADTKSFTDNAIAAFSGASGGLESKAITSGDHFHVIASSSQSQYSYAKTNLYGLTTWALCEAMGWSHNGPKAGNKLDTLEGDANGDLKVTVGEAYSYASSAVSEELAKYNLSQDMQAYPANSSLTLISRSPAAATVETPKATYASGALNFTKACIAPGKTLQLALNVSGATQVNWATSKSSVAKVDEDTGLVTGVNYSYSIIPRISVTYLVGSNSYYAYCDVRVLPARYVVDSVRVRYPELTLEKSAGYTMPVKLLPASARYKKLRWSTSDKNVATVTSGGRITAVAESGTATITATSTSGVTATVTVNAIPATPKSVRLDPKKLTLLVGKTYILTETILPAAAKDKSVIWESNKQSVATVNDDGQVVAVSPGKAVITCTTTVNGRKATCAVTVAANQSIPRTRPKSAYGKMVASARKIYYNESGMLCVDMFFYNRTDSSQTAPLTEKQVLVLKLRSGSKRTAVLKITDRKTVAKGAYILMTIKANPDTYPQFKNLDLRGSDAWCQVQ